MSQAREVFLTLTEIDKLLADIELKITNIIGEKGAGTSAGLTLRQEVRTLNILMMSLERLSGTTNLDQTARKIQYVIMLAMRARMAIIAIQTALIPGAGAMSFLYAGVNVAAVGFSMYDALQGT